MKRIVITLLLAAATFLVSNAQEGYLPYNPEESQTWISTRYFGPNAFPVPDMVRNTAGKLEIRLGGNAALGHLAPTMDKTFSLDFGIRVPLWTERVNLSVWGEAYEWYRDTPEVRAMRRVRPEEPLNGGHVGDISFSVDIKVLKEGRYAPNIVVRAACKSANGGSYTRARYYDCPGYFFDACIAKNFPVGKVGISTAISAGFLCWQVDNGRQNDAVMYGASLGIVSEYLNLNTDFGGYVGWKKEGDQPMTLKVKADILPGQMFSPFIEYQHGFIDWPFYQVKVGLRCSIGILRVS